MGDSHSPVITGCLRCVQTGSAHHFASMGGMWTDCSLCSLGDAGATDAEPSGCIATGKQLNKATGPLGTLLELLLS